jgi:NAD(P)-dependent dehydrogenase (short-subunit alcohol dehydrogenase family)
VELSGRTAIISGGASGLGAATARRFASAGARVAILDRNREVGESVADDIGGFFAACDVGDATSVEVAFNAAVEVLGPPRIAVCCAGIGTGRKLVGRRQAHDLDVWNQVINVNLTGTFNVIRLAAWEMKKMDPVSADGERGVLITTSSIAAFDGADGGVAYAASKGGVASMTLPLARDLAQHGIRAVSIAPGTFETALVENMPDEFRDRLMRDAPFPKRFGAPDEYANLAEHIVGNTMMNGAVLRLDGGLRMQPSEESLRR